MTTRLSGSTLGPLVRSAASTGAEPTDGDLLGRFIDRRDEDAFAALVRRHGPMVWGVCRRVLPNEPDAEDAFQATFLILALKAVSVTPAEMVGNWLYGVARTTALKARRTNRRRAGHERPVAVLPEPESPLRDDHWNDLLPILDAELSRLPDRYRAVIVLCDLEGVARREAARRLGLPEGTVNSRLARARTMLANRLTRRGVALSVGAMAALLSQHAAACVPVSVVSRAISAASPFAAGPVSVKVAALTEGVLKAMLMSKLKAVVAVVLLLGFIAAGATALSGRWASARGNQPPATEEKVNAPPRPEPELNRPGAALPDLAGTWQGDDWGTVVLRAAKEGGFEGTYSDTFGKDTGRIAVRWSASSRRYEGTWSEGTYRFGRIALDAPKDGAITGAYATDLKCEHQPGVPSLASLRWSKKQKDEEKEPFTAWGKEINGLQAGLGFRPGEKRAYSPGETVKLVVRVRNVGKEAIKFRYLKEFFMETPPAVTDGKGKPVSLGRRDAGGLVHVPVEVNLAPGKEIELAELKLEPRTQTQSAHDGQWNLFETGTFRVQYEQLAHPDIDKILGKLATGKLELEVKSAPPAAAAPTAESPEEKVKKLKLVEVYKQQTSYTTKPTPQAPLPPVIHFFWGKKNEVRVAPGQSALIELPKRVREVTWNIPGYVPDGAGDEDGPEFDYVYCKWDKDGKVVFTMYKKP